MVLPVVVSYTRIKSLKFYLALALASKKASPTMFIVCEKITLLPTDDIGAPENDIKPNII